MSRRANECAARPAAECRKPLLAMHEKKGSDVKVLSSAGRHTGARATSRRGDVVTRCLEWTWALGTVTAMILLLQLVHNDLGMHPAAWASAARTLPDEAALQS